MRMGVAPRPGAAAGAMWLKSRRGRPRSLWPTRVLAAALGGALLAGCDVAPMPETALLKPQPPPKCDARSRSASQKQSASAATADSDADARLRQLDYEAQCYRHAEMIARSRLGRLQQSVHDMERPAKSKAAARAQPDTPN